MILVAGATGMLGGLIVDGLLDQGKSVRALVRSPESAESLRTRGAETATGDLKDPASLDRACVGADVVITTANSASRGGDDNPQTVEELGNRALVNAARAAGVRQFVFISALGSDLDSPVPFLRGKAIAERYLKESGLTYTILMPNLFMEIWCPNIVGQPVRAGQPVTLIGEGTRKHSMISAADVARFAVAAVGNERAHNRVLVLGGPQPVTWHDVVAAHERVLGRQIEVRHLPIGDALPGYPDFVSGFMTLLESYDSIIPMDALVQEFGVRQVSLDESVPRQLQAAATTP
ncbi:MAG: SDR family oxidoreductase [Actinomycetota bacterium]